MKALKVIWDDLRSIINEIKTNWQFSKTIQDKKLRIYALLSMNVFFFLAYLASCYVAAIFILFGLVGGIYYGLMVNPFGFLLFLLPFLGVATMYITHLYWKLNYPRIKEEFFQKHGIQRKATSSVLGK